MSVGRLVRRMLGRHFQPVGEAYRAIFVDVSRIAERIARELPQGANCLDIGGGDGMIANAVLDLRGDVTISMIDIAETVGGFISERNAPRVRILAATELRDLPESSRYDAFIVTDVLHHVPENARTAFFADLRAQAERAGCRLIIVKDIEPGSMRSALSVLSDKYITGDRSVALIGWRTLEDSLRRTFGDSLVGFSADFPDAPNYCAVARLAGTRRTA